MKNLFVFTFIFSVFTFLINPFSNAQEALVSQSFSNPIFLNPAFTGGMESNRFSAHYKNYYPAIPGHFWHSAISYDQPIPKTSGAFGINYYHSSTGEGAFVNNLINLTYAHNFELFHWKVRPAVNVGFGKYSVDASRISFGGSFPFTSSSKNYTNLGFGIILSKDQFVAGFAVDHINQPNLIDSGGYFLNPKISIHAKYSFDINENLKLIPAMIYINQDMYNLMIPSLSMKYKFVKLGIAYRNFDDGSDALISMLGYSNNFLSLTYNYDWTLSKLSSGGGGCHELSLIYRFHYSEESDKKAISHLYEF